MKRRIPVILILTTLLAVLPSIKIMTQTFKNEGEAEKVRIKEYFKESYKPKIHEKFTGEFEIKTIGNVTYVDFDSISVILDPQDKQLQIIFLSGLIPKYMLSNKQADSIYVCCLEELTYLKSNKEQRRFKFLVFYENFMNPSVFLIELTNKESINKIELDSFVKGAELTFIKNPWIQI